MKNKVYVIVGMCEDDCQPVFLAMGQKKAYRRLRDAKEELKRIMAEVEDNDYDFDAQYGKDHMSLEITFHNSYVESYYIYELKIV